MDNTLLVSFDKICHVGQKHITGECTYMARVTVLPMMIGISPKVKGPSSDAEGPNSTLISCGRGTLSPLLATLSYQASFSLPLCSAMVALCAHGHSLGSASTSGPAPQGSCLCPTCMRPCAIAGSWSLFPAEWLAL